MYNMPQISLKVIENEKNRAVLKITPLVRGFGYTIGSALRRTLYSSTKGSAITKVVIEDVFHQFDTIEGVKDDVLHILLALKKVRIKKLVEGDVELKLDVTGPMEVKAGDIEVTGGVEIVNKNLVITSLSNKKSKLKMKLTVSDGYGYVPADENSSTPKGHIMLDASFSPIVNVVMEVEDTRVGRDTNFDELTLTVRTDGTVDPVEAVRFAATDLKEFFFKIQTGEDYTEEEEKLLEATNRVELDATSEAQADEVVLEELHLPTRTINALKKAGIKTLGDLGDRSEDELLKVRNLGEKSIREILSLLKKEGLSK